MILENIHKILLRLRLLINRFRVQYTLRRKGKFKIVIPEQHHKKIKLIKYFLTVLGLLSALIAFSSIWIGFLFGCALYLVSFLVEKIAFAHSHEFIHPLPGFEMDPEKWVGVGFRYAVSPDSKYSIPLVSMAVTDVGYAKKLESLFLKWTGGSYRDESKNIKVIVVLTKPDEYIFLCYPNPRNQEARSFFQRARDKLRNVSLEDEIAEKHLITVLGKRCKVGKGTYFPQFRQKYQPGIPVVFEFILPSTPPEAISDIPNFVFFDFSIKDKSELTRKDLAYDAIRLFKYGGKWQGPTEEPN